MKAPRRLLQVSRYLWASPCSAVGLIFAAMALITGGTMQARAGIIEVALSRGKARSGRWVFEAITFGHVVLGRNPGALSQSRLHELAHVAQYERWGVIFFLAYPASSLVELLRGRNPYWFNYFEVQARAHER